MVETPPMRVRPTLDRMLVRLDARAKSTRGGILLPEQATTQHTSGTVIAVGPGRWQTTAYHVNGKRKTRVRTPQRRQVPDVRPGDRVLINQYGGQNIVEPHVYVTGMACPVCDRASDWERAHCDGPGECPACDATGVLPEAEYVLVEEWRSVFGVIEGEGEAAHAPTLAVKTDRGYQLRGSDR